MSNIPAHEQRLARVWGLLLGATRTAESNDEQDRWKAGYNAGRADGIRAAYCAAAGIADQAVRDRLAKEIGDGRRRR